MQSVKIVVELSEDTKDFIVRLLKTPGAMEGLGHEICMGIRHGLFGSKTGDHSNIHDIPAITINLDDTRLNVSLEKIEE